MTTVEFQSKHPHRTRWLAIAGKRPTELIADLTAIGWTAREEAGGEVHLSKPGTGCFGGWTDEEREANLTAARRVLAKHGINQVKHRKLDWRELI